MFRSLLAAAVLAALPLTANASSDAPRYGYIEFGVARADQYGDALKGFSLKGSLPFTTSWYGFVEAQQVEYDPGRAIDLVTQTPMVLGAGYRLPVGEGTDLVFEGAYLGLGSELLGQDFHNDGARAAFGVRSRLAPHIEIEAKATGTAVEEFDTLVGLYAGVTFSFSQNWGVALGYHMNAYDFAVLGDGGEVDVATLGVRYTY